MKNSHSQVGSVIPKVVASIAVCGALAIGAYFVLVNKTDATPVVGTTSQIVAPSSGTAKAIEDTKAMNASTDPVASEPTQITSTVFKNGTYKYIQNYDVPKGGQNTLIAEITVENDTVTAISASSTFEDRDSVPYINGFKSSVNGAVVAKKLASLSVSRIGGASLTSGAFANVISKLQSEAKN
jgi:hypothetical protein